MGSQAFSRHNTKNAWLLADMSHSGRRYPFHSHLGRSSRKIRIRTQSTEHAPARNGEIHEAFTWLSQDRRWKVRSIDRTAPHEIARVVELQTECFYEGGVPFQPINSLMKDFFRAEVLGEMTKKVTFNPADRFVMLVVESYENTLLSSVPLEETSIVGVMELSLIDVKHVLEELGEPDVTAVPYLASMAIDPPQRRKGAASALLEAAETIVGQLWQEPRAVLHVFQDNDAALRLYKEKGYDIVFADATWWQRLGARPRYLMRKIVNI